MTDEHLLRNAYDAFARTYDAQRGQFDMSAVFDDFLAHLPTVPGALLDLGCGAGEPWAQSFITRGWDVTGVDFCPAMLALAARHVPEMTRIAADMRGADFAPASFDAVTAVYSLFHVPSGEHPALFARLRRWLRPGGRLLFTYATRAYTGAVRFEGYLDFMGERLFYSHATPDELVIQLVEAGLEVLDWRERDIGGESFLWVTAGVAEQGTRVSAS